MAKKINPKFIGMDFLLGNGLKISVREYTPLSELEPLKAQFPDIIEEIQEEVFDSTTKNQPEAIQEPVINKEVDELLKDIVEILAEDTPAAEENEISKSKSKAK